MTPLTGVGATSSETALCFLAQHTDKTHMRGAAATLLGTAVALHGAAAAPLGTKLAKLALIKRL